jgi:hypothetical protein
MSPFIIMAFTQVATVYGFGEFNCGEPGKAIPCINGAITASGAIFNPNELTVAIPAPKNVRIREQFIWVKNYRGFCTKLKINDKKHWKFIGKGGFDLTPAAVKAITGKSATKYWSGKLEMCKL